MTTVYHCKQPKDGKYIPPQYDIVHQADTEAEAIEWLEDNGGGVYENVLHNFTMNVKPACLECGQPAEHVHPAWSYDYCCSQCLPCEIELETERLQDEIEMLQMV